MALSQLPILPRIFSCSSFRPSTPSATVTLRLGHSSRMRETSGGIQERIMPDGSRILEECPNLNVTLALRVDGPQEEHEKTRRKIRSWEKAIDTTRQRPAHQR